MGIISHPLAHEHLESVLLPLHGISVCSLHVLASPLCLPTLSISLKPKRIKRPSSYRGGHQGLRKLEDEITDPVKSTYSSRGLKFNSQPLDADLQSFTKFPHPLPSPVGIRQQCGTHTCRSHTCTHTCSPTLMR